ncbi:sensor histidine kinase [Uliginosibacterium aquaticum]|uniref:histidine kinase n=1 Tax=Uliginosibacterium aquaticum TaxID=2731212 RepID=A0ABX2IJF2_9RHOO|nr:ATP-binding protein [Uliginosibacterium aquaticum]NSL54759.1 two-component sensor histidine kinase [Uliginosibacterium aquaticum]
MDRLRIFRALLQLRWWLLAGITLALGGALLIGQQALDSLRAAFETDARIVHRVLSQRVVQHEAILATLSLLQPEQGEDRLSAVYSQILAVRRRADGASWPEARLSAAEAASRQTQRVALAGQDFARGRYTLLLAGLPASHALDIGLREMLPREEWPGDPQQSPMRVELQHAGEVFLIQPGRLHAGGWQFAFEKHLAAASQPFNVVARRSIGWPELPWGLMLGWTLLVALGLALAWRVRQQQIARQRAEELLRMGQVARLNSLGELAAGMAHELNQPLTAVLANTQAACRLLADEPPELDTARQAMTQAVEQARRASEVVGRLRRVVERPEAGSGIVSLDLLASLRNVLHLLEPETLRRGIAPQLPTESVCWARAEPVALEQILHNLLMNAFQALDQVPAGQRSLRIDIKRREGFIELQLRDSGPGIPEEVMQHLFEPFYTTRAGGLGLGLSLCETLALSMGGSLRAEANPPQGACFILTLPAAEAA